MNIRVVTINLAGLREWFESRAEALLDGLRALLPDVICCQEATIQLQPAEVYHQVVHIGEALGLPNNAFTPYGNPAETLSPRQGGIAILSRWPIRMVENRRLPTGHAANDHRVALLTILQAPEGDLRVVNTHLSWRPEEEEVRMTQVGLLLDYLRRCRWCNPGRRLIFAGDLNATSEEPAISLVSQSLKDAFEERNPDAPGYTWTRENPWSWAIPPTSRDRRIDYIFCSTDAEVVSCRVVLDQPAPVYPSDHFGVFAELRFVGDGDAV